MLIWKLVDNNRQAAPREGKWQKLKSKRFLWVNLFRCSFKMKISGVTKVIKRSVQFSNLTTQLLNYPATTSGTPPKPSNSKSNASQKLPTPTTSPTNSTTTTKTEEKWDEKHQYHPFQIGKPKPKATFGRNFQGPKVPFSKVRAVDLARCRRRGRRHPVMTMAWWAVRKVPYKSQGVDSLCNIDVL